MIEEIPDPFTAKGVQMLVDGVDKDALYDLLEAEIEKEQYDIEQTAKLYESMGGYSPTMGILGAVLGLIHAMGLLDRPDELGQDRGCVRGHHLRCGICQRVVAAICQPL